MAGELTPSLFVILGLSHARTRVSYTVVLRVLSVWQVTLLLLPFWGLACSQGKRVHFFPTDGSGVRVSLPVSHRPKRCGLAIFLTPGFTWKIRAAIFGETNWS